MTMLTCYSDVASNKWIKLQIFSFIYGQVVSKFRASKYNMVVEKYQWKDLHK